MTAPLGREEAYLVILNIEPQRAHELWYDSEPECSCDYDAGTLYALDLRRDPITYIGSAMHTLAFYLPRQALMEFDRTDTRRGDGSLVIVPDGSTRDRVVESIGHALLPLFCREVSSRQPLVDHLLQGLCAYVACNYSGRLKERRTVRGGLAPWQQRLVKQMISDKLAVGVSINELADACGLSAGALFRGFKQSSGMSPHQWLLSKRIEAAIEFMQDPDMALSQIALSTGFFDQSHFSRTFTQITGVAPGAWRKTLEHGRRSELA